MSTIRFSFDLVCADLVVVSRITHSTTKSSGGIETSKSCFGRHQGAALNRPETISSSIESASGHLASTVLSLVLGAVVVATLFCGGSAFSVSPSSGVAAGSRHEITAAAAGSAGRDAAVGLPTSRKEVLGAVFGAVAASSFAFVAAADAKVCLLLITPVRTASKAARLPTRRGRRSCGLLAVSCSRRTMM